MTPTETHPSPASAPASLAPASGYAADLQPTISLRELNGAVMNACSCGGGGPDDKHTCPACQVYHRLVTLRHNDGTQRPGSSGAAIATGAAQPGSLK